MNLKAINLFFHRYSLALKTIGKHLLTILAIYLSGRLGLLVPMINPSISLFWLPTGIGLAVFTWFGSQIGLSIVAGTFAINIISGSSPIASLCIAFGSTLGILITHLILKRIGQKNMFFQGEGFNLQGVIAAAFGMSFSATIGVVSLYGQNTLDQTMLLDAWKTWWMGDFLGVLLATPFLLAFSKQKIQEIGLNCKELLAILALASLIATRSLFLSNDILFVSFTFLTLTWAVFRLGQLGASGVVLFIAAATVFRASSVFAGNSNAQNSAFILWSYMCSISIFTIFLSSLKKKKDHVSEELVLNLERLSEAQKLAIIGSWELDFKNNVMTFSRQFYQIFEINESLPQEMVQQLSWGRIHHEDVEEVIRLVAKARSEGVNFTASYRLIFDDGKRVKHIRAIGNVHKDKLGNPIELTGTCQDLSEVVMAQEENRFILDVLGIGVWKYNPNDQTLFWDKSMYNVFDVKAEDFSGHYEAWESTLTPEAKATVVEELGEALRGEKEFDTIFEIHTQNKGNRFISGKAKIIRDKNGNPLTMYGVNIDETEKKKMEQSLKEAEVKLIHSSRLASLGEMSAGILHEINNPLAIISGSVERMLKHMKNDEKTVQKLETIQKASNRISKIMNGLKKFSRISDEGNYINHSLSEIINETLIFTEAKAKRQKVPIAVTLNSNSLVLCDDIEIEQVLVNMVNNAIDAVKGLKTKWVKIDLFDEDKSVVIKITDSGPGIPENIRNKLFDPFFTTKEVGEGTGLGLSITKGILDEHKATISLLNDGPNTCFEIRFPVSKI